ncbi:hypothetical protein [Paenibacillus herberti]|uniref:Uncharacterized protein n=1 Tax=Paenibacillus herberti TaxID=1619309 RepID=A0A229P1K3_9BACL|nr:hypothetical protein [Paenibacillus herberti]OXM15785.1 hypothetical protein CGZ75_03440 [Paenibacillus herberti]
MIFNMAQISHSNNSSIGLILVLFILLLIVTHLFYKPLRGGNGEILTEGASRQFHIINATENPGLTLVSTKLWGDFESPPPQHVILPGETYPFEVSTVPFGNVKVAYAMYNVVLTNDVVLGSFRIDMKVSTYIPSTQIYSKNGSGYTLNNGNTYVYVRNN